MLVSSLVFALAIAAAQEAPAPPAVVDDTAPVPVSPPPAVVEPPPAAQPPPAQPPAKPRTRLRAAPPADPDVAEPTGMSSVATTGVQLAVGTGACCAGCCFAVPFSLAASLVPVAGVVIAPIVSNVVVGATIGTAETWAGDAWGNARAPLLWPMLSSVGFLLVGGAASTAYSYVTTGLLLPTVPFDPTDQNAAAAYLAASAVPIGISCVSVAGAIAAPALIYAVTAEPKRTGDDGRGFPGLTTPAHAVPAPQDDDDDAPAADDPGVQY